MKMNHDLGFRPVPFSELTHDPEFWKGCQGCRNFNILENNQYRMCLCTGLLYDPEEHQAESAALKMQTGNNNTENENIRKTIAI